MTIWYVRPDTSHSGTRNGQTYATAWGGWSEIIWGASGVKAGDTLYVCGPHLITSAIAVGTHGAGGTSATDRVTISGGFGPNPGSINVNAAGGYFLQMGKSHTTLEDITVRANTSYALYFFAAGTLVGVTVRRCTLNGGTGAAILNMSGSSGLNHSDLTIDDNDFIGVSGASLGSAINWLAAKTATPLTTLERVTITNNRFTECSSNRAVIHLRAEDGSNAGSTMADIVVSGNSFIDCRASAMEIYAPDRRNAGIRITDNIIRNQIAVGTIGGGMSIGGFGPSLTDGFGSNVIARNEGYVLHGPTGLVNVFYGTYRIFSNIGEDLTTDTIDGSGILFDHGNDACVAFNNLFRRLMGKPGIYYSGNGITVLDSTNVRAFGNVVEDAYCGIHFGNQHAGQSSDIHNNTFVRCSMAVDMLATADKLNNLVRNNIFTANGSVPSVRVASGTWTGESNNCFHGFGAVFGHTLSATTDFIDPRLDHKYRPQVQFSAGTYLPGKDFYGKPLPLTPILGAVVELPPHYDVSLAKL
ncbi:MAG TPA: NosD domain-containing protein [Nitrosospira sp.]|nr:NosD domain-containing protein [Nitrosospira sp.]